MQACVWNSLVIRWLSEEGGRCSGLVGDCLCEVGGAGAGGGGGG